MTDTPVINSEINGIVSDSTNSNLSPILNTKKAKLNLEEFEATQKTVAEIKAQIGTIIDSVAKNQSMLTRAALLWGKLPLWQKIGAGVVLIAPTLILGIVFQTSILIVISALTLISFVASSLILDNHYNQEEDITDRLKDTMIELADSLGAVLQNMEIIRSELADEIEKFYQENERLTNTIVELSDQIKILTRQSEELIDTEKALRATQIQLEKTNQTLNHTNEEQKELLNNNKLEIEQTTKAFENTQLELSQKIVELGKVRVEMGEAIQKAQKVANTLQEAVEKLSIDVLKDSHFREEFLERLNEFMTNKEKSFDEIAVRICEAKRQLSLVKSELDRTNLQYHNLLERQEKQVCRLEKTTPTMMPLPDKNKSPHQKQAQTISKIGIHAHKKNANPNHHNNDVTPIPIIA